MEGFVPDEVQPEELSGFTPDADVPFVEDTQQPKELDKPMFEEGSLGNRIQTQLQSRVDNVEESSRMMAEDEQTYLDTSTIQHFKKRVVWLVSLAAVGLISGVIIHHYQIVLEQLIILALYMPMMTATGGNTGSQAATVVIRAMALGQANEQDWFKILFKELIL